VQHTPSNILSHRDTTFFGTINIIANRAFRDSQFYFRPIRSPSAAPMDISPGNMELVSGGWKGQRFLWAAPISSWQLFLSASCRGSRLTASHYNHPPMPELRRSSLRATTKRNALSSGKEGQPAEINSVICYITGIAFGQKSCTTNLILTLGDECLRIPIVH